MTPTARTLKLLRDAGMAAAVVEKWIPQTKQRIDLFGVIDVVALDRRQPGVLGVQATSGSNHASRVNKLLASAPAKLWVECGNRLQVVSWRKGRATPKGRLLWLPRMQEINLGDFAENDQ